MIKTNFTDVALYEHRFWLQILGEHARFIRDSLGPTEQQEIKRAEKFILRFDGLLAQARQPLTEDAVHELTEHAYRYASKIREFKLALLRAHLVENSITLSLTPSFLNHMVSEVEEYLRLLTYLRDGRIPPPMHSMHHHMIWLHDAVFHAAALQGYLDFAEYDLIAESTRFQKQFEAYYQKASELAGYLRANIDQFPALSRFNCQVDLQMRLFRKFLLELEELELTGALLNSFSTLLPDHMAREECYYLHKLSEVAAEVQPPDCDPTKVRDEPPKLH